MFVIEILCFRLSNWNWDFAFMNFWILLEFEIKRLRTSVLFPKYSEIGRFISKSDFIQFAKYFHNCPSGKSVSNPGMPPGLSYKFISFGIHSKSSCFLGCALKVLVWWWFPLNHVITVTLSSFWVEVGLWQQKQN